MKPSAEVSVTRGPWWLGLAIGCAETAPSIDPPPIVEPVPRDTSGLQLDTFVQVLPAQVDFLFAISSASSMGPLHDDLAVALPAFFAGLLGSGIDYHIGVTSTDLDAGGGALLDGGFGTFLDADTPSPLVAIVAAMSQGTGGGETDQEGLAAVHAAWFELASTTNAGFHRPAAAVHTLVVTDSDDMSTTITPAAFVEDYATLGMARTFTVLGDPASTPIYGSVADDLGGSVIDATTGDLATPLAALGLAVGGYQQEFFLSRIPIRDTLEVSVMLPTGAVFNDFVEAAPDMSGELAGDWTYDASRNSVTFLEYLPTMLSTVRVEYVPAGT